MSVAHGGQVVISQLTEQLARESLGPDVELVDLGEHRLRDLAAPMHVFQVTHRDLERAVPAAALARRRQRQPARADQLVRRPRAASSSASRELVGTRRLLTLTGVGGVGKTRLALQAAVDALPQFPGGAWLAELARTGDPDAVGSVVVARARTPPRRRAVATSTSSASTSARPAASSCSTTASTCSTPPPTSCRRCWIAARTSSCWRPAASHSTSTASRSSRCRPLDADAPTRCRCSSSARQSVDPEFVLDGDEPRRGRGDLPPARRRARWRSSSPRRGSTSMAPADIAARSTTGSDCSSSGRRGRSTATRRCAPPSSGRTNCSTTTSRCCSAGSGVFAGGFTADGRARRCAATTLALASLVRKSLVQFERDPAPGRYRLLETVRVFALEQLAAAGEADTIGRAPRRVGRGHRRPSDRGLERRGRDRPRAARGRARQLARGGELRGDRRRCRAGAPRWRSTRVRPPIPRRVAGPPAR